MGAAMEPLRPEDPAVVGSFRREVAAAAPVVSGPEIYAASADGDVYALRAAEWRRGRGRPPGRINGT
jgi:hypothetical protein